MSVKTGADFIGQNYQLSPAGVQALEHHTSTQQQDLKMLFKEGGENFEVRLTGEGGHLIVIETKRALTKMDCESFTAYLKEEGLDDIYYQREKAGMSGDSATESISRSAIYRLKLSLTRTLRQ